MVLAGVDGCRAGWLMVKFDAVNYTYSVYSSIQELFSTNTDIDRVLIDIPIGLSEHGNLRTIDQKLRQELKPRSSTVFNAPCRIASQSDDYRAASELNRQVEGKGLSKQTFNIIPKIREVDEFIQLAQNQAEIIESHPELCLKYLNDNKVLMSKKSTTSGIEERLSLLNKYDSTTKALLDQITRETKRTDVKLDDITDAICLCLTNILAEETELSFIKSNMMRDALGIDIKVAFFKGPAVFLS